jgi:hypothetical protein
MRLQAGGHEEAGGAAAEDEDILDHEGSSRGQRPLHRIHQIQTVKPAVL